MLWILHKTYAPKGGPKAPIYVCPQSRRLPARKRSTCCGGLVLLRGGWRRGGVAACGPADHPALLVWVRLRRTSTLKKFT